MRVRQLARARVVPLQGLRSVVTHVGAYHAFAVSVQRAASALVRGFGLPFDWAALSAGRVPAPAVSLETVLSELQRTAMPTLGEFILAGESFRTVLLRHWHARTPTSPVVRGSPTPHGHRAVHLKRCCLAVPARFCSAWLTSCASAQKGFAERAADGIKLSIEAFASTARDEGEMVALFLVVWGL